ncbi:hypothetical protein BCR35DRAFT_19626 [Leucosporidium creatinivorum]|uniref:Uncharacterized protein n=1 Tax=Leucosporidium creatinivorum TaxID=106004 RepID=A0A1Y2CYS2_9BASI|nr:hypothetical protein BCR35DRAFT_19626 [Leucosporidium creatinivorum]
MGKRSCYRRRTQGRRAQGGKMQAAPSSDRGEASSRRMGSYRNNAFALDEEVFHPKKLTKKGWESVQDHVVGLLTGIRDARLEREARGRQRARRNQLKDYHQRYQAAQTTETKKFVFPSHLHFIALRSVRPLWEEDVELDDARFAAATPAIDFAIQCLRVKIITKLFNSTYSARVTARYHLGHNSPIIDDISAISTTYLDPPDPKNKEHVLRLVSSIIYCKGCSTSGFYPEFVSHACPRDVKQWGAEVEAPLVVDGTWVAMVWSILAAIGKKEAEVQGVDELEQVGKRFVCGSCLADQVDGDQIHAYGWKLMIEHAAGMHGRPSEVKLLGVGESFLTTKKGARVRVRV